MLKRLFFAVFACLLNATVFGAAYACTSSQIDVLGDGTQCETSKFGVTTTSDTTSLIFSMTATGTFYVDCGDGGTLSGNGVSSNTIARVDTSEVEYTCTWGSAGAHAIKFGGVATGYNTGSQTAAISFYKSNFGTQTNIAAVSGSLGTLLPQLGNVDGEYPRFASTFYGTSNLTSVPDTLFSGLTGGLRMFDTTFGHSGLTSIPSGLFGDITTSADNMFYNTFYNCTGLTSIPAGLFSGITTSAIYMFYGTFANCKNLAGSIPPTTFAGLIANSSPTADHMWFNTFDSTQLATSCPVGTTQYTTGYEGNVQNTWNGKVSCGCAAGTYGDGTTCTACSNTKPEHSSYSGTAATNNCPWACDDGYVEDNGACVEDSSTCDTFTVTTTNLDANTVFSFYLSAAGVFNVDWGDGSAIQQIDRTGNNGSAIEYQHTYTTAGSYTIGLCGTPTAYHIPSTAAKPPTTDSTISFSTNSKTKVASVNGSLGALFPTLNNGATDNDQPRFYRTFLGCSNLSSIPTGLFNGVTGSASDMFRETFDSCRSLTSVPPTLFSGVTGGAKNMFRSVLNATGLTELPAGLFSGVTQAYDGEFKYAFFDMNSLTGYIPPTLFSGLIANGSPGTAISTMWENAFAGTNSLATSCDPYSMEQYMTGYEEVAGWNSKVSCQPANCSAGQMLISGACANPAFTVTTTSNTSSLTFALAASGAFYVDCGDGGTLDGSGVTGARIIRNGTNTSYYTCTWETAGTHTIKFGGTATAYGTDGSIVFWKSSNGTQAKIASFTGSFSDMFPQYGTGSGQSPIFMNTFRGCTNLTSIPASTFSGITDGVQNMFAYTFYECTNLASIPTGLFDDLETGAQDMFANAFYGCTSLTSIPSGMFGDISTGAASMFYGTFKNCTGITAIPSDLFSNITSAANNMFSETFNGCTNLSGYIPSTTFAGLVAHSSPTATDMWLNTFNGTNIATSCTSYSGMRQYTTGYEGNTSNSWNGRVSCEPLPNNCTGATYYDSVNEVCTACPTGYDYNTDPAKESASQCEIHCAAGTYVAVANGACVAVGEGYYADASTVAYGQTGTRTPLVTCTGTNYRNANNQCVACPTGYTYNTDDGKTSINDCQIHCNAGHYLASAGDSTCSEVGDGYYAAASTVNYGSASIHTQCSNPEERTGTTTAESEDECMLLCTGATYFDRRTDRCVACPSGYTAHTISGKNSASQCQIACAAGTYLAAAGDTSCIPVGIGYYAAASTVNYGSTSTRTACPSGETTSINNATSASDCLLACTGATYRNSNNQCVACPSGYTDNIEPGKTSANQCQHRCAAGTYMTEYTPVEFLKGNGSTQFIDTKYAVSSANVYIEAVVGTAETTTGDIGNFFGNIYETGGFSSNYKQNVFGFWLRTTAGGGDKAKTGNMTFTANQKYTINYTVTGPARGSEAGQVTGTMSVNGGTQASKSQNPAAFNAEGNSFMLFTNGAAYINEQNVIVGNRWGDKLSSARIYSLKLWDGGTTDAYLKLDLVPVRRNTDNVLGFYNRVNGAFYTNVGTGTFTTATCSVDSGDAADACDPIATCSLVDYGYYASENYTNYGSSGVRNKCPNDAATIVNGEPVNNAGSIYACEGLDPCTGANYPDYITGVCTPCPTGYNADTTDNKESISQCKIHCNDGYYLAEEHDSACTAADDGYYAAAGNVKYGLTSEQSMCTNAPGHSSYTGNATTNACPWVCDAQYYADNGTCVDAGIGYYSAAGENERHQCTNTKPANSSYSGSAATNNCPYACDAGYYAVNGACVDAGVGYYSPAGDDDRYECTNTIPTHSSYNDSATTNNCPWECDTGYEEDNGACVEVAVSCEGATYLDDNECVACPTGYTANTTAGKSSETQCQIACVAGTYLETANDSSCTSVGVGYWSAASTVNYGSTGTRTECTNTKPVNSSYTGSATTNACPYACDATYYLDNSACVDAGAGYYSPAGDNARYACDNSKPSNSSYSGSAATNNCPWSCDSGYSEDNGQCVVAACTGATYLNSGACTACPTGYDYNTTDGKTAATDCQINCGAGSYLATANDATCTDAGVGYWAAGGAVNYGSTSTRTQCATGLTTVGYGHGADASDDCGYKLNIGSYVLYAKSSKPTTPALNFITVGGNQFYIGASSSNHTLSKLHMMQNETEYTAYDDSLFYGERNFLTGQRIQQ